VLDRLATQGANAWWSTCTTLADQIERHVASRKAPQIVISDERTKLLNTGGGVVKALPKLGAEPFFHINSDTIWIDGVRPNLERLAEAFDRTAWMRCCCSRPPTTASLFGARRFSHGRGWAADETPGI